MQSPPRLSILAYLTRNTAANIMHHTRSRFSIDFFRFGPIRSKEKKLINRPNRFPGNQSQPRKPPPHGSGRSPSHPSRTRMNKKIPRYLPTYMCTSMNSQKHPTRQKGKYCKYVVYIIMPPHQLKPPPSPPVSKERNTCIHRRTLSRIKPVSKTTHKKLGNDDDAETFAPHPHFGTC